MLPPLLLAMLLLFARQRHDSWADRSRLQPIMLPLAAQALRFGTAAVQSTLRPFLRRAASTLRPPTEALRVRKPDTLARLRREPCSVQPRPFFTFASTSRGSRDPADSALRAAPSTAPAWGHFGTTREQGGQAGN